MRKIILALSIIALNSCEVRDINKPGTLVPKTVDQDSQLPSLKINNTHLHFESFGNIQNPILIFLHGGPGGDYRALISESEKDPVSRYPSERTLSNDGLRRLADQYYLVFYDQRSAGLSRREEGLSFAQYKEDLDAIVDYVLDEKLDLTGIQDSSVNLFAWSFGGILATGYINDYPEKIDRVVFYEPGPFSKEIWDYFKENTTSIFSQIGKEWLEEYLHAKNFISPETHEQADYSLMLNVFRAQPEFYENPDTPLWRFGALLADDNLDFSASEEYDLSSRINDYYKGEALFIAGSLTVTALPEYIDLQMEHYKNASYLEIPNTGHTGPWEKPAEISQAIRNFLK